MQYHQRTGKVSFVCGVVVGVIDANQESNGLSTEPCGTPALGLIWLERELFTLT